MATRTPKRSEWHLVNGKWSRSLGERGMRIRLFQNRKGGMFYRAVFVSGKGRHRVSLGTRDRAEAERLGKQLLADLLRDGELPVEAGPVTLSELWRRYSTECDAYLDNADHTREDTAHRVPMLIGYFGEHKDVRTIAPADIMRYVAQRKKGGIRYMAPTADGRTEQRISRPGRQRTAQADLVALRTMLRWACTVYSPIGGRWLDHNPLDGLRFERERNPLRPVASDERYRKTRATIERLVNEAPDQQEQEKWVRLELALFLANATGRRRGAIVGLRWEDIDFAANRITWHAEYDKKGVEWVIPMPARVMEELRQYQRRLGAIGGFVFPMLRNAEQHIPADMLSQWLRDAEIAAGLPKLKGGVWHPYRRKWASERMHLPIKAVAEAGGWKDVTTLMRSYQHADEATLLAVMDDPRKWSGGGGIASSPLSVVK